MDVLTTPAEPYGCDWNGECMAAFATRDELDAHEREHWAAEDARNEGLRSTPRYWGYNTQPGLPPASNGDNDL